MPDIEKQLLAAARKSGLSMLAISKRAGLPYACVHNFLASGRGITFRTAARIAGVLGLELRPTGQKRKGGG